MKYDMQAIVDCSQQDICSQRERCPLIGWHHVGTTHLDTSSLDASELTHQVKRVFRRKEHLLFPCINKLNPRHGAFVRRFWHGERGNGASMLTPITS